MMDYVWNAGAMLVELTNIILCYTQILQMELCDKKRRIAMVYAGTAFSSVLYTLCSMQAWSIFLKMAIVCVAALFVIKGKRLKTIVLYPCAYTLESAVCIICSYIVAMILNISQMDLSHYKTAEAFLGVSFSVIIGIKCLYDKSKGKKYYTLAFGNMVYAVITIGSVSFLFILSAVQFIGENYNVPYNQTNFLGFLLSCVCMIFFCLFLWLASSIYKNNVYEREKDMMKLHMVEQEKYIKLVIDKDMDMRSFRHDVKEHMSVVSRCIEASEYDEAKKYIDKMYETFSDSQIIRYTGVNAVDAIIFEKKRYMDKNGIMFDWEGSIYEFPLRLEMFDMCTLFANILNNAIEACDKLEDSAKRIEMTVSIDDDKVYIMESNMLKNAVSFDENGNPVSIKNDIRNHGYGSKNIRAVVEKYNGEVRYNTDDGRFSVEIIV